MLNFNFHNFCIQTKNMQVGIYQIFKNQKELIDYLKKKKVLKNQNIINAFLSVDRKNFVLEEYQNEAYNNYALPIGYGQTISQPETVAVMLEFLNPQKNDKVLDVGSGSGYTTALLSKLAKEVYGVERIKELVEFGNQNLKKEKVKNAKIYQATDRLGLPEFAPFDKILVSAQANEIPKELLNQLKIGGTMVIPVNESICKIEKLSKNKYKETKLEGFVFVPLIY